MKNLYDTMFIEYTPFTVDNVNDVNKKIISSEMVFLKMLLAIKNKKPFSVIRMGDGEAAFIKYYLTDEKPRFLTPEWRKKFGIANFSTTDLKKIGKDLLSAAQYADVLGISLWGEAIQNSKWNTSKYMDVRTGPYCSNWFNMEWIANGCANTLVNQLSFAVMHNNALTCLHHIKNNMGKDPRFINTKQKDCGFFVLNGNLDKAEIFLKNTNYDVYLISGGPASKPWMVEMSKKYNKVIIDLGHAMSRCWSKYKST